MTQVPLSPFDASDAQDQVLAFSNLLSAYYSIPLIESIYDNGFSIEQLRRLKTVFEILISSNRHSDAFMPGAFTIKARTDRIRNVRFDVPRTWLCDRFSTEDWITYYPEDDQEYIIYVCYLDPFDGNDMTRISDVAFYALAESYAASMGGEESATPETERARMGDQPVLIVHLDITTAYIVPIDQGFAILGVSTSGQKDSHVEDEMAIGNCDSTLFLGGREPGTLKELSTQLSGGIRNQPAFCYLLKTCPPFIITGTTSMLQGGQCHVDTYCCRR